MGDEDDVSMDELMDQLKKLKESYLSPDPTPSKTHTQPWDDPMLKPLYTQVPVSSSVEDEEKSKVQDEKIVLQGGPTGSGTNGSIIRAMQEALKEMPDRKIDPLGNIVKIPKDNKDKIVTITRNTDAGLKDLKQVRLDELCDLVDSDVEIDSTGGRYLLDLYHGYQLMIKRIIERYPKGNFKNPADYFEREIFDSISGIIEEEDIAEIIFELTGDDTVDGGIEALADLVFEGLNDRFLEKSGWGDSESVTILHNPVDASAAKSRLTGIQGIDLFNLPLDKSGSMNQGLTQAQKDKAEEMVSLIRDMKDADF